MPQILSDNITVGVSREELIPNYWSNWENLRKELTRHKRKQYGIKRARTGGGKNRTVLIDFDTLPKQIQEDLGDPRKGHLLERYYRRDGKAARFYKDFTFGDYTRLLPEAIERYTINASVMEALIRLEADRITERKNKGKSTRGILKTLAQDAEDFKKVMNAKYKYVHNIPTSQRFTEAYRSYKKDSYISLIKDMERNSMVNALKADAKVQSLLNSLFAEQEHKPTPAEISSQYDAFLSGAFDIADPKTGELYNPKEYPNLSERFFSLFLNKWESSIGTHAKRSGDRQKYMTKFTPYHSFKQPTFAGSIISVDDRQPPFEYEKGKRLWFYNGIDLASECFTTFVYGKSKEGIILDFYRQMVRNYHAWGFNIPAELEGEISLNNSYKDTFLKPGEMFEYVNLYANRARSKRIEAYYKQLRYGYEKKYEGWIARPFALSEANQSSNIPKKIIPYNQLVKQSIEVIYKWNNTEHSKVKGKTRWEVFSEMQNPDLAETNYQGILPYLGYHEKTSCNVGISKLQKGLWLLGENNNICTGEDLIRLMKLVEGKTFDVYWLDGNDGSVIKALVYLNGQYICDLLPKPNPNKAQIERTPEDDLAEEIMIRYEATVNGFMRTQKNAIKPIVTRDHRTKVLNNDFAIPGLDFAPKKAESHDPKDTKSFEDPKEYDYKYTPGQDTAKRVDPFAI